MAFAIRPGQLYVVATPIGNLEDISYRAVRVLREVDLIAAEDTRAARVLLGRYGVETPTISYHRDNEARRALALLARLKEGTSLALISEAGLPGISDPGARLVSCCIESGIPVDVIPGPSASLTALVLSGLPAGRFTFVGFLPRKAGARARLLEGLRADPGTLIFYEAPGRTAATVGGLLAVLGDRRAAVLRELTKIHQEALRGTLSALVARLGEGGPRGEVTIVVEGCGAQTPEAAAGEEADLEAQIDERLQRGESPGQIARELCPRGRRRVYQLALARRRLAGGEGS